MASERTTPIHDAADELSLSLETVRRDIKRGCPFALVGRKHCVNVPEYKAWRDGQGLTGERGRPPKQDDDGQNEKDKWLARKYRVQALREEGAVIDAEVVHRWINEHVGAVTTRLAGMGDEIAPRLEGRTTGERAEIINGRIRDILRELSGNAKRLGIASPVAADEM